jgi:hypothetical protein
MSVSPSSYGDFMWYRTKLLQQRRYSTRVVLAKFLNFRSRSIMSYSAPIVLLLWLLFAERRLQPAFRHHKAGRFAVADELPDRLSPPR